MLIALPALAIALAWTLLVLQVDPVPTWFYVFVWYPTLILADAITARVRRRSPLLSDLRVTLSLFLWSPVVWLLFEAINFRIVNWYYVFLPAPQGERWAGILISFATVVPAVILAERLLDAVGVARTWRIRPLRTRRWELWAAAGIGLSTGALALASPLVFFPLIWGAVWLIADPFVYRHRPEWSLLHDLSHGELGRIGRLMLGGLSIGLLWEFYNAWARGKWIYTVPWLEHLKLFEMPPFGFVGFPFFALEAWSLYHALCVLRVAVPVESAHRYVSNRLEGPLVSRGRTLVAALLAVAFTVATLLGMERWTISSVAPRLQDLPGITTPQLDRLRDAGISSPFELARSAPHTPGERPTTDPAGIAPLRETAQLVTLRGIGARHAERLVAVGVPSVCELARREPATLWAVFHGDSAARHSNGLPIRPTRAEVRVWVRAARQQCPPQ